MHRFLVILLALALAGCTSDDPADDQTETDPDDQPELGGNMTEPDEEPERQVVQVTVTWSGVYMVNGAYSQATVSVPANSTVELTFVNDETAPTVGHDLVVEGIDGASTAVLDPGQEETITFDVGAPQETKFFCSVPGHRANDMEGDFIIE